jgi:hypothetical protein
LTYDCLQKAVDKLPPESPLPELPKGIEPPESKEERTQDLRGVTVPSPAAIMSFIKFYRGQDKSSTAILKAQKYGGSATGVDAIRGSWEGMVDDESTTMGNFADELANYATSEGFTGSALLDDTLAILFPPLRVVFLAANLANWGLKGAHFLHENLPDIQQASRLMNDFINDEMLPVVADVFGEDVAEQLSEWTEAVNEHVEPFIDSLQVFTDQIWDSVPEDLTWSFSELGPVGEAIENGIRDVIMLLDAPLENLELAILEVGDSLSGIIEPVQEFGERIRDAGIDQAAALLNDPIGFVADQAIEFAKGTELGKEVSKQIDASKDVAQSALDFEAFSKDPVKQAGKVVDDAKKWWRELTS